ncbi:mucin-binding protein [Levilactobacillus tujiorum]|uniref:mucin-binding protein n=1 Tax=Levilactobacillus tujiorum TaxID=2912243 RepID=UPI0014569590|nr:LPXTG cell wall anchor domain-containing protein [Levilactobacillus tujiorum]NLR31628.1 LPXTG cell wall anchor domain-containing protein [Levilactobacillus tujiorum]
MRTLERKTHYKMYKSHRGWLVAGITVTSMAVGIIAGPQATPMAHADDNAPVEESGQQNAASGSNQVKLQTQATSGDTKDAIGTDNSSSSGSDVQPEQSAGNVDNDAGNNDSGADSTSGEKNSGPASVVAEDAPITSTQTGDGSSVAGDSNDLEKSNDVVAPVKKTTVTTGITVQNPDDLTNKVTGQPKFNITDLNQLQYTYDHTDSAGHNTDLRVVDGYNYAYQVQGAQHWLGETYANQIAQDAKGVDAVSSARYNTQLMYIDEWLPDYGLQYFLWQNNYAGTYATIADFRNNFTKAELGTLTSIYSNDNLQAAAGNQPTVYYQSIMAMRTLEGLQNAVNLQVLSISPNLNVSEAVYKTYEKNSNLWDIRALSGLKNLREVQLPMASINDISALGNHEKLTEVGLIDNQITDISPLATDKNLLISNANLTKQHVLLAPIKISDKLAKGANITDKGMLTYTTPSFIIKDLAASNLPIHGFDNASDLRYPSLYPSSADAGNLNSNTLAWYNLLGGPDSAYGSLSTAWSDTNSDFSGYIIQPYELAANVSDLNVNIQLLQANGQQLNLAPATLISGDVGSSVNVQENPTVVTLFNQQFSKGYTFSGLILDGTGLYSDYLANNGKASAQASWETTLTDESKNWTILFYKDVMPWNLSVVYGTKDAAGDFTPITNEDGTPVTDSYNGTSDTQLALSSYQKDFPDYVYVGAETSVDGKTWTDISQNTDIPFTNAKQAVRLVYAQAKRATVTVQDATTGKTVQVLDYTTNPELRGAIGTTSTFDSSSIIDPEITKGYKLVSDTTKNADGTSAIVFAKDATNLNFTISLAHAFETTTKAVNETITYQDQQQKSVAKPVTATMTFATITDQVTQATTLYSHQGAASAPTLDVTGKPTDTSWTAYQIGDQLQFDAVKNPAVAGMHVVATTDPANDLTQTTSQNVAPDSADLAIVVTYAADPTTGGGGDNGNNGGGDVTPPTTTPDQPDGGGDGDQVADKNKPKQPTKTPAKVNKEQGQQAATVQAPTNGGQGAKVQQLTATSQSGKATVKPAAAKAETQTLPQTNDQTTNRLAVIGLALLGATLGVLGLKKREH